MKVWGLYEGAVRSERLPHVAAGFRDVPFPRKGADVDEDKGRYPPRGEVGDSRAARHPSDNGRSCRSDGVGPGRGEAIMTKNAGSKRRHRVKARGGDDSYSHVRNQRSGPWRENDADSAGHVGEFRTGLARKDLERGRGMAEKDFRSTDPYRRAEAYALASRLYDELARHTDDPTWKHAARMAAQRHAIEAARIRWQHRIPTITPGNTGSAARIGPVPLVWAPVADRAGRRLPGLPASAARCDTGVGRGGRAVRAGHRRRPRSAPRRAAAPQRG